MPTTVRVEDEVKLSLDKLQGDLLADRGERVSHSELLARLVGFARRREAEFLSEGRAWRPPTRAELDTVLASAPAVRARARARDVDAALYGKRP
ncbi:MAG: hypothetical protein WDA16_02225 [Candidatus Thermoplasmatota archaeon]|jgi:hypothetical protein